MVKYLCTGAAVAALLVTPIAAPAVDLSLTSIYQGSVGGRGHRLGAGRALDDLQQY